MLDEKILYHLAGELSETGVPIVVKGALVTKLILMENNYDTIRNTRDIDIDWVEEPLPPMEELVNWVNRSLEKIRPDLYAALKREYIYGIQTAGIDVSDKKTGEKVFSIDVGIGFLDNSKIYNYENITFQGVLPIRILADKICALSGDTFLRRAKDLMDIYALSRCVNIQTKEILNIWGKTGQTTGNFNVFLNRLPELEKAYNKLLGIVNKPPFQEVYSLLNNFIRPFVEKNKLNQFWDYKSQTWSESQK
jgi:hypothetical protein